MQDTTTAEAAWSEQLMTFPVRISKKHYDMLQEVSRITGRDTESISRSCLEAGISEFYELILGEIKI